MHHYQDEPGQYKTLHSVGMLTVQKSIQLQSQPLIRATEAHSIVCSLSHEAVLFNCCSVRVIVQQNEIEPDSNFFK